LDDPLIWVRALHFASTMAVAGAVFFMGFVAEPSFRAVHNDKHIAALVRLRVATITWTSLALAVVSGAGWLILQADRMGESSIAEAFSQGIVWTVLSETDFGHDWMVRFAIAVSLAAALPWLTPSRRTGSRRTLPVAIVLAAGLVGTLAWAGHAAGTSGIEGGLHLTADVLHLVSAAAWVGALIPLALLLRAARDEREANSLPVAQAAVRRFSTLGVASVGTLLASGLVNSWVLAGSVPAMVGTDYGHLLLVKVALFLVMLTAAAVNRLRLTPRLVDSLSHSVAQHSLRRIERNSFFEASVAGIIIIIVSVLGTMQPGLSEQLASVGVDCRVLSCTESTDTAGPSIMSTVNAWNEWGRQ
jgi:copper resistance protein D